MQFGFFFLSGVALFGSPAIAQWQLDGRCYTWICDKDSIEPNLDGETIWTDSMCDCLGGLCKRRLGEPLAFQKPQSALYNNKKNNQLNGIQSTFEDQVEEENSGELSRELYGSISMSIGSKPPGGGYKLKMWWHEWSCWQYETVPRFWCAYMHATQPGDTTPKPYIDACNQDVPGNNRDFPNDKNTFGWDFVAVSLTESPTSYPTLSPSMRPSSSPSSSIMPSGLPTVSIAPSTFPSASPSISPSSSPSISASPTTTFMPSNNPSISFETIAMATFLDSEEEKKITSIVLLAIAISFLVAFGLIFALATRKAKKDQLARNARIALYWILLFSICFFLSGLIVYLIPVTLATRPAHESDSSLNERRVLKKKFAPAWAYQIKNVRLNVCMTSERVSSIHVFLGSLLSLS
jgi:hypothetical protein